MLGSRRMRNGTLALLVGVAVVLVGAAAVAANSAARRPRATSAAKVISLQPSYDSHGNPSLLGQAGTGNRPLPLHWLACPATGGSACRSRHGRRLGHGPGVSVLTPGRTPSGTFFQVVVHVDGRKHVARSAVWLGTVKAIRPPTLTGHVRAGARVTPHEARWSGGWSRAIASAGLPPARHPNSDELSVEACRTATGRHCVNLTPQGSSREFRRGATAVPARYRGWYLFAFDHRIAQPEIIGEPGYPTPEDIPVLSTAPTVARSAAYGPVSAR